MLPFVDLLQMEIDWVRHEFYIITETCIDGRILTFPIQVPQFSIAFLQIANTL